MMKARRFRLAGVSVETGATKGPRLRWSMTPNACRPQVRQQNPVDFRSLGSLETEAIGGYDQGQQLWRHWPLGDCRPDTEPEGEGSSSHGESPVDQL